MAAVLAKLLRHTGIAALLVMAGARIAAAVTPIDACGALTRPGETYVLTADLQSDGVCLLVAADRVTIDLRGHTITGPGFADGAGIWDGDTPRQFTTVKNGSIQNFFVGVLLEVSSNNTLRSVTTSFNSVGMAVGPLSLIKGCTVRDNQLFGIVAPDLQLPGGRVIENRGQIENCVIGGAPVWGDACHVTESGEVVCTTPGALGNVAAGISGGSRMLITRNQIMGNGWWGVSVGVGSTITYNLVRSNGFDGIFANARSLVTGNLVEKNQLYGIHVFCASTLTMNTLDENVAGAFFFENPGCIGNHNTPATTLP